MSCRLLWLLKAWQSVGKAHPTLAAPTMTSHMQGHGPYCSAAQCLGLLICPFLAGSHHIQDPSESVLPGTVPL